MKVVGLNGKEYNIKKFKSKDKDSEGHTLARKLIKEVYPLDTIWEEVELPGTKENCKKNLYADFLVPRVKILFEVHGKQHYEFVQFFHGTKLNFIEHKKRDARKKLWCEINDIIYVELPYNEDENEWRKRISSAKEAR